MYRTKTTSNKIHFRKIRSGVEPGCADDDYEYVGRTDCREGDVLDRLDLRAYVVALEDITISAEGIIILSFAWWVNLITRSVITPTTTNGMDY